MFLKVLAQNILLIASAFSFKIEDIVDLTSLIFVIIGFLIYNEIIILYFCGLGNNTKLEIKKRANQKQTEEANIYIEIEKQAIVPIE